MLADTAFASDIGDFFAAQRQAYPGNAEQLFLLEADALRDWEGEALKAYDRGLTTFPRSFSLLYGRAMVHEQRDSSAQWKRISAVFWRRTPIMRPH